MSEPWCAEPLAGAGIPTMISPAERRYLHWLGRALWSGRGAVLEIGPWLGGSTACLAAGMRRSGHRTDKRLHVCDAFVWLAFMSARAELGLAPGDSFEAAFRRNLEPYAADLEVHTARLPDEPIPGEPAAPERPERMLPLFRWDASEPVELLFVDGAKSWTGLRHLLATVGPALLPERSQIVCQDYAYWGCYWVPAILERLRDRLELEHVVKPGSTVTFRVRSALSDADLADVQRSVLDADAERDLESAAAALRGRGHPDLALQVSLSRVRLHGQRGDWKAARRCFQDVQRRWPLRQGTLQLERARHYLSEAGGHSVPRRSALVLVERARRLRRRILR